MRRELSESFMQSLEGGHLKQLLDLVRMDSSLCLCIRENYINIYYRGGSLLKLSEKKIQNRLRYETEFASGYTHHKRCGLFPGVPQLPKYLSDEDASVEDWVRKVPLLKQHMDMFFAERPKEEREFQQLLLRENNGHCHNDAWSSVAKATDYFICDIEYTRPGSKCRFDAVAVKWPSSPASRARQRGHRLALIEVKYADKSLKGGADLCKHMKDLAKFLEKPDALERLKEEMLKVFGQLQRLKLVACERKLLGFDDARPEYILILANHDPDSRKLREQFDALDDCPAAEVRVAVGNFMGYGLYDQAVIGLQDFKERFATCVCSKVPK